MNESKEDRRRLLRVAAVAERLDVTVRYVWTLIAAGKLKSVKLGPRCTRIADTEVARFVREQGGAA